MAKRSELSRLRDQVKEQRALLRRAQRWIGVAAGALATATAADYKGNLAAVLHHDASNALSCGADISKHLEAND